MAIAEVMEAIQKSVAVAVAEAMQQMQAASLGAAATPKPTAMQKTVDTVVKRMDKFNKDNFQDWRFRLEMFIKGNNARLAALMNWSELQEVPIDPETSVNLEDRELNDNLYYILAQLTDGEAFVVVKDVEGQNGGEAWRKLC